MTEVESSIHKGTSDRTCENKRSFSESSDENECIDESDSEVEEHAFGEFEESDEAESDYISDLSDDEYEVTEEALQDNEKTLKSCTDSSPSKELAAHSVVSGSQLDEYDDDSSDEEDLRSTIGNIPINWYDEYPHLGYNWDSEPITKPPKSDTLDRFLDQLENPDFGRTVFDKQTGQRVRMSEGDLEIITRVLKHKNPDALYDMYTPYLDLYSHEVMEMPVTGKPEHKRSFLPSQWECREVIRMCNNIRKGIYRPRKKESRFSFNCDLWNKDEDPNNPIRSLQHRLQAPKVTPPGHGDSYHPPPEYLPLSKLPPKAKSTKKREDEVEGSSAKSSQNVKSIRLIPSYKSFVKERFRRCIDLYLAPRKKVYKIQATSKDLLPVLPKPEDLRPFPAVNEIIYKGHRSIIRTISVHPLGQFIASGSDDYTVKIWEVSTGRCLRSFAFPASIKCVAWNPNKKLFLLAVVYKNELVFLSPETYLTDKVVVTQTNNVFKSEPEQGDYIVPERVKTAVTWKKPTNEEWAKGYRVLLTHFKSVKQIVWHRQGDYFATLIPEGDHRSVLMHQLSRWRSQVPFSKCKGHVQAVSFHPKMPFLYVASQSHIRVYNLQKQKLTKKVKANSKWISSIAVHPGGEHFLIGTYDKRVSWFEMECTRRPHILRYHKEAIRAVGFHRKYPLFASASDDGTIIVSHGMVYNDWLKDPLLVPLKELKGHSKFDDLYALDLVWHPHEPYLFTSGADGTVRLWH